MSTDRDSFFASILSTMKAHFGYTVGTYWVYDNELCPCCRMRKIDVMDYKGENALSINACMCREHGVLIAYLLCGQCAKSVLSECEGGPTDLHSGIEQTLTDAYLRYLNSQDA